MPTWGYCVPVLPKLETKSKVTMKIIHSEKRGDQICFLTQIGPHRSFTPSFGFALPAPSLLPVFFINSSLDRTKSCNSCELILSFIEWDPGLLTTLYLHSNWGSNRDYRVKLRPRDRVIFKDNSRLPYRLSLANFFPCNAGLVAGVYAGMEYGMERVRGKSDWVN